MSIKLGTSGVRGTYLDLTPEITSLLAEAFSTYIEAGKTGLAIDTRPSGKYIHKSVISGLMSAGTDVYDYGLLPTPVLQWIIKKQGLAGGISISGGHTSFDWNSLIFLNREGAYLNAIEVEEFFNLYHSGITDRKAFDQTGKHLTGQCSLEGYLDSLSAATTRDGRPLKFVVDCAYGAAGAIIEKIAKSLNVRFIPIFNESIPRPGKDPEPNKVNANILSTIVRETNCDGGFLLNSDASRILVVDEKGTILSEELTLPIFAEMILQNQKTDIVTTFSTSKAVDKVANRYGVKVHRTDVGPPSVLALAKETRSFIGGEGSGSIVYTPFSYGYDSFYFIRTLADYLRTKNISLSQLAQEFDEPEIYKKTIVLPAAQIYSILEKVNRLYENKTKLKDGFYIELASSWLCVRASSTMSMIRIVAEGPEISEEIERLNEATR